LASAVSHCFAPATVFFARNIADHSLPRQSINDIPAVDLR
jgi:hypothetical protein